MPLPTLSRLVAIGVCLDCTAEALIIAAGISLGRPLSRNVTPLLIEDPDEYNATVRLVSEGRRYLDAGMYSDALSLVSQLITNPRLLFRLLLTLSELSA